MANIHEGSWRATRKASSGIPLGARSCGHGNLEKGWIHGTGRITWTNLYWTVDGCGGIILNGEKLLIPKNHIALHYHGDHISGYPIEDKWRYRWVTLDGDLSVKIMETFGLRGPWPRLASRCPEELFDLLECQILDVTQAGEIAASATAYRIIAAAAEGLGNSVPDDGGTLARKCAEIIDRRLGDRQLSVSSLAREVKLHRSRLTRIFSRQCGMPPVEYIKRMRITRAISLLRGSDRRISEIAYECGFSDPAYFSRCITDETGMSPRAIRQSL
jgi:AraC-like DNA-binding protein